MSWSRTISSAFLPRSPLRKHYVLVGAGAFAMLLVFYATGFKIRATLPPLASFWWSVVTGLVLLGCILYQWMLFFARLTRRYADGRRHWRTHRYVGAAAIVLFVIHAGAFGYALVTVVALLFVIVAATGLFNAEVLILRKPWLRACWEIGHVGLSGLLMPLIALHIWAALAFK